IERDAVGIVNQDQIIEAPMTSERTCLGSDAFLHVAVTAQTEDVMIKNRVLTGVEAGRRHFRGRSNPNSIADSLPKRSRGAFHSGRVAKFRVSRRFGMQLPEPFDFRHRQIIAAYVQPCTNRVLRSPPEREFRYLDSWKRRKNLNFRIKLKARILYMAEHSTSTMH